MSTYLPAELRQQLVEADDHRCAYGQTTAANTGQPMVLGACPKKNQQAL